MYPHITRVTLNGAQVYKLRGTGLVFNYLEVEEIDDFCKSLVEKGFKPSSEPRDWPWDNRKFVIRDPDGYKLVFYEKIK